MNVHTFIDRLLRKRPLAFFTAVDQYLLPTGKVIRLFKKKNRALRRSDFRMEHVAVISTKDLEGLGLIKKVRKVGSDKEGTRPIVMWSL